MTTPINPVIPMICPKGHEWKETYPKGHPSFGMCPVFGCNLKGERTKL